MSDQYSGFLPEEFTILDEEGITSASVDGKRKGATGLLSKITQRYRTEYSKVWTAGQQRRGLDKLGGIFRSFKILDCSQTLKVSYCWNKAQNIESFSLLDQVSGH